jgi:hypothetical protein
MASSTGPLMRQQMFTPNFDGELFGMHAVSSDDALTIASAVRMNRPIGRTALRLMLAPSSVSFEFFSTNCPCGYWPRGPDFELSRGRGAEGSDIPR